ncbi:PREDICTED: uncharacterized protein LOC109229885 [Nicotiana attenuata]|uniref:uncharacterized protein LOC109229885 n=1 Tax=Nicotiana attenuata TaxID=49451 RepID=UPI00090541EC|nr:PREDICTED: uncharacterized protein LOC109229885 [Nicotiana attenuata]
MGSSLFLYDNWTGLGALYIIVPQDFWIDETAHNVYDVVEEDSWNLDRLPEILPEKYAMHIVEKIKPPNVYEVLDVPYWMLETRGFFSVRTAWEYLRRRDEPRVAYKMIWVKGLQFKIAFFMWKVWKVKLPLDDFIRRLGYCMPSRYWCCTQPKEETLQHLFFKSDTTRSVWSYFLSRAGIAMEGLSMHQAIIKCWTAKVCPRLKPIMQAMPSCIVWELWKRRNNMKYGDAVSTNRVIYQVSSTLQALVRVRKPGTHNVPHKWHDLLSMMENYTPRLKVDKVLLEFPGEGWLKVNTDGASRGNPGRSAVGYCVKDENGDIVFAAGKEIHETTETEAEAMAIVEALRFCRMQQYFQVEEIMQLFEGRNNVVSHVFRERNKLADHLANYALDAGDIACQEFWQLDVQGRRIVNEYKLKSYCPNVLLFDGLSVGGISAMHTFHWGEVKGRQKHRIKGEHTANHTAAQFRDMQAPVAIKSGNKWGVME